MTLSTLARRALAGLALIPAAIQAEPVPTPLARQAAEDYATLARYPEWSAVIEAGGVDPLVEGRLPTRQSRLGPNGAGPRLSVWASAISAMPGETVTLYASLSEGPSRPSLLEAAPAPVRAARVTGELIGRELGTLGAVDYRDDGAAPDLLAGDGIHTARFTLPESRAPALGRADSVMVKVAAVLSETDVRKAAGGFLFSHPAARLTGRYTDRIKDGNLVIAAEIDVLAPGRVHLAGTVADALGQPVASAQAAASLPAGRQWLDLAYYGLAFHDRGAAGVLTLASVTLTSVSGMPHALGPVMGDAHRTRPYSLAQFTALPYDEPALLEQARRLQRDAAATLAPPR